MPVILVSCLNAAKDPNPVTSDSTANPKILKIALFVKKNSEHALAAFIGSKPPCESEGPIKLCVTTSSSSDKSERLSAHVDVGDAETLLVSSTGSSDKPHKIRLVEVRACKESDIKRFGTELDSYVKDLDAYFDESSKSTSHVGQKVGR